MVALPSVLDAPAETIAQLLNQLQQQHYSREDLCLIHSAYGLTVSLGTCQYRSSGRTIIEHQLGSASVLAAVDAPPALVTAGVIHAAYVHGDFGTMLKRVDENKRARVRRATGDAAEEITFRYSRMDRNVQSFPAIRERLPHLDNIERDLLLLRLADLLDIYGAQDVLYVDNVDKRRWVARNLGPAIAAVTADLGYPSLAAALTRGFTELGMSRPPAALTTPAWKDEVVVPRSYRIRPWVAIYQRLRSQVYTLIRR